MGHAHAARVGVGWRGTAMPVRAILSNGGAMGERIRTLDWAATPLGPVERWPDELCIALGICLGSAFPTAIYWGRELRLLYNDAWAPIPAEKHPEALGRPAREVWSDIWHIIEPQLQQVLTTGRGFSTFDQMLPMERGGVVHETYWNYSFTAIRGEHGEILGVFNQGHETTSRIRTERALRYSRIELEAALARLRAITDSIDQMIWSTLPDGYHDYFNQRWYDYTGVQEGATDGDAWNDMFHPDDRERTWAVWRHSLATGEPYHIEYRLRHRSGAYRWVLGRAQPVRDEEGRIVRWYGTCTDIQDIVDAREVLARSRSELEVEIKARTAALMQTEEQLRQLQKMEAVGRLTGGIAHDFNNMLAVVIGALNLLERRLARGDTDIGKYIEGAKDGARRAAELTQRLLAFSRQQPLSPAPISASQLVAGMQELLDRTLGERITVETRLADDLWQVNADRSQLENVLLNLAVNARDAMPDGGTLTIKTRNALLGSVEAAGYKIEPGEYVIISVKDTGSGMSPEIVEKAFDPFFTTKSPGKGTGLGLSQVFGFVRQSGGHVTVESSPGQGATFCIFLPRLAGEHVAPDPGTAPPESSPQGGNAAEVIMVVEDDDRVRSFSVEALRELGYTVVHSHSAVQALQMIEAGQAVTLLFTDIVMQEMTGHELAKRALGLLPHLRVLFTTGYSGDLVEGEALHFSPANFIAKPFTLDQLAVKVRSVMDD
jgi:PAS domain S-box-containing protein